MSDLRVSRAAAAAAGRSTSRARAAALVLCAALVPACATEDADLDGASKDRGSLASEPDLSVTGPPALPGRDEVDAGAGADDDAAPEEPELCPGVSGAVLPTPFDAKLAVGVADSRPYAARNPTWPGLNVVFQRSVRPIDVATAPCGKLDDLKSRANFEAWLNAALAAGVEPFVVFNHHGSVPTADEYEQHFVAFRAKYPMVQRFGAWNEPNSSAYLLHERPKLAAELYRRAVKHCNGDCVVAAGELMDWPGDPAFSRKVTISASSASYVARYMYHLGSERPRLWSLHAWHDVIRYQQRGAHCLPQEGPGGDPKLPQCATRWFLGLLGGSWSKTTLWLTEQGPFYRMGCDSWVARKDFVASHTCKTIPHALSPGGVDEIFVFGEAWQAKTARFVLNVLVNVDPRIARIYFYDFQATCRAPDRCKLNDSGLVSPRVLYPPDATDGTPRQIYDLVANWPGRL